MSTGVNKKGFPLVAGEMRDGVRKVLKKRESKSAGKAVYSYKVPYRDATGKQTSETFDTFEAAKRFRNKVRSKRDAGLVIDEKAGRISVRDYAATYLKTAEGKRANTYALREIHLRLHIVPVLGGRQVRAVTREDVQDLVNALTGKGLAPLTVIGIYKTLVAVFHCARLDNKITQSPCVAITLPEIPDHDMQLPTVAQVQALASALPERYRVAVLIAAGTGLRVSEVLALTWDRINLQTRTLTVDRQIDAKRRFAPVKTKRSKRPVPLPEMVIQALLTHRAAFPPVPQTIEHTTGKPITGARLVLTREDNRPVTGGYMAKLYSKARETIGITSTFHTLRHLYASLHIAAGTSLKTLQERMGHSSIKITSDTYGHLLPGEDDRTRAAIDNAFTNHHHNDDGTAGHPKAA